MSDRAELKLDVYMGIAYRMSLLGTCPRKQVGAIIMKGGRIVSSGYNGAPPGQPHCVHPADVPCETATHAELNAVVFAARHGIATEGGTLFVTLSPCLTCSRLLIAAGIETVYYEEVYRDDRGLDTLESAGVRCQRIS